MSRVDNFQTGRRYTLYILAIAFTLGLYISIMSMQFQPGAHPTESEPIDVEGSAAPIVAINTLRKEVVLERDEYILNETIVAEAVIVNDSPHPVRITPPTAFDATGYNVNSPTDERVSQGVSISWAESEIEILANSSAVLCSFHFTSGELGPFIIRISGFPEKEVLIVEPDRESPLSLPVSVKLNKDTFSVNDKAQLIFTNRGSKEVTYGSQYDIERLEGDEWVEVFPFPSPFAWTAELRILPAWETTRQKIKIDTLEPGHYRVHKKMDIEAGEATFTLEFDICGED